MFKKIIHYVNLEGGYIMKKVCVSVLMLLLAFGTGCYGAVSEDTSVYVRKDVFEVYMQNINANMERILHKIDSLEEKMNQRIDNLNQRIDNLDAKVNNVSDGLSNLSGRFDGRIDELDKRIDDLRNGIYLWLVAISLVISWPKVQDILQKLGKPSPSFTLEDVKRLIEENNAELKKSLQV